MRNLTASVIAAAVLTASATGLAATPPYEPAVLLAATQGQWQGELQYRDYQSNTWQGLPVKVTIAAPGDGLTVVRTAAFDDGPKTGTVWITTLRIVDPAAQTVAYAGARKGRAMDGGLVRISQPEPARDAAHWVLIESEQRIDGSSMAQVRETTTRDGDTLTTLKEVNPLDDGKDEWLPRNRTVLTLVRPTSPR